MTRANTQNELRAAAEGVRRFLPREQGLLLSREARRTRRLLGLVGHAFLFLVTSSSALAVLFIFIFIAWDALPFFFAESVSAWARAQEFFAGRSWVPSDGSFGALTIFLGSGLVTVGAALVAVPLGVAAAVCLSDILPFWLRQYVKPVIEVLAAIPSVAYGFFALVVLAPLLQSKGGPMLAVAWYCVAGPVLALGVMVLSDLGSTFIRKDASRRGVRTVLAIVLGGGALALLIWVGGHVSALTVISGRNALNVSLILGVMALPTVVSVSEDALQAVGRELREGAYALGSTRAEMLVKVVIPAASSGILAAVILGMMRAVGETMVVWMASGNAAQIPEPFYNLLEPVRTLTATIAGDMGEADQSTGSAHYHVLFAMALALLVISFVFNVASEWVLRRQVKKLG